MKVRCDKIELSDCLNDVLGINLVPQGGVELAPGHGNQLLSEAPEQFAGGVIVPSPQPVHPFRK